MDSKNIYISSSAEDHELAINIKNILEKFHFNVFISYQALDLSERVQILEKMNIMILLFSKETLKSCIVDNEVTEAINRQVPIVPYQVDETTIKECLSLDFMLKKSQWVLGYPDRQKQMDDLIVSVCRYLGVDAVQNNPTDPFEQLKRGIALEYGTNGLEKDRKEAMLWITKSAKQGNYIAMHELYKFYRNSEDGNQPDYSKAKFWLIKTADAGLAEAQYQLGTNYEVYDEHVFIEYNNSQNISHPLQIERDLDKAHKYYTMAVKQGHKKAMFRLAIMYLSKSSSTKEKEYAFQLLSDSAEIDNLELWLNLGRLYQNGIGCDVNLDKAKDCYIKAKFLGEYELAIMSYENGMDYQQTYDIAFKEGKDSDPRYNELRARFYLDGKVVNKDITKAAEYYRIAGNLFEERYSTYYSTEKSYAAWSKAAKLGDVEANYKVGMSHFTNEEYGKAYLYLNEAALKSLPIAMYILGYMYLHGLGVAKDAVRAINWLKQADIPGLASCTVLLGDLYLQGIGINQNCNKAIDCYLRAANQTDAIACQRLSQAYEQGWGVDVDASKAKYWHQKAIDYGLED